MLHSRYIVVVDLPDGSTSTPYQGADSVKAEEVFAAQSAKANAEAVLLICHPVYSRVRFPLAEASAAAQAAEEQKRQASAGDAAKLATLRVKRAELAKLQAEVSALGADGAPGEAPAAEDPETAGEEGKRPRRRKID